MPCPATPVPVAIVAQHGPDQVGVASSTGTGARKPACPSAQTDGALCRPQEVEPYPVHPDDEHVPALRCAHRGSSVPVSSAQ